MIEFLIGLSILVVLAAYFWFKSKDEGKDLSSSEDDACIKIENLTPTTETRFPSHLVTPAPVQAPLPAPTKIPETLGEVIKAETPVPTPAPKKPRRPRQKKVAASPEIVAKYAEPKVESDVKLDTRLDGYATPPKAKKPAKKRAPKE